MARKHCAICGGAFDALGAWKTCSPECSKQNRRDNIARVRQARSGDNHTRKVDRELDASLRLVDRLDYVEERNREYAQAWRDANREHVRQYGREQYAKNRAAIRAKQNARPVDREAARERNRRYYQRNIERVRELKREDARRRRRWAGSRLFG